MWFAVAASIANGYMLRGLVGACSMLVLTWWVFQAIDIAITKREISLNRISQLESTMWSPIFQLFLFAPAYILLTTYVLFFQ